MDDKALEELCKWHDEQAAMLRSEAGNLAAAAVAADMHAKTSAALHEAATEIKQLRLEAGLSASDPPTAALAPTSPLLATMGPNGASSAPRIRLSRRAIIAARKNTIR